jgi:hypothetical protein
MNNSMRRKSSGFHQENDSAVTAKTLFSKTLKKICSYCKNSISRNGNQYLRNTHTANAL